MPEKFGKWLSNWLGKPIEKKEVYRELIPVTKENVDEYLNESSIV
jgi:hypothetical protein